MECVAGCISFKGGEIYHHKDCPYYEDSFSKMYNDLKSKIESNNFFNEKENACNLKKK